VTKHSIRKANIHSACVGKRRIYRVRACTVDAMLARGQIASTVIIMETGQMKRGG
jgi:hypothetical protein